MGSARAIGVVLFCLCLPTASLPASGPQITPGQAEALLAELHPDHARFIRQVRYGSTRLRPEGLYAGLVRPGGEDPRDPSQGPRAGRGVVNDLVIYADSFEPWRTDAWRRLVIDHEYLHARHLARDLPAPWVGFGRAEADSDWYEALAWGYVVRRADEGAYGRLSQAEIREAGSRYREHRRRFERFVAGEQPSAWMHYGRFLPDPDARVEAEIRWEELSAPRAVISLEVDPATR